MLRQCAWCLRLIDLEGERLSAHPLPKLYEASHGMCSVCGALWMEDVLNSLAPQNSSPQYIPGLPTQSQEHIMVCEDHCSYSSAVQYLLLEGQEALLDDDLSKPYQDQPETSLRESS